MLRMLTRYEILRQKRHLPTWLHWEGIFILLGSGLLIFHAFWVLMTTQFRPAVMDSPQQVMFWSESAVWIIQFLTITRGILAGINAARDGGTETWDLLVLSRVTPPQIFLSKWRAALSRMNGYLVALGFTRLIIILICFVAFLMPMTAERFRYAFWCIDTRCEGIDSIFTYAQPDNPLILLVIAPMLAILLSVLEVLASTMLGLMVGMLSQRIPFLLALVIRFTVPVVVLLKIMQYPYGLTNSLYYLWNASTSFALVDSGTVAILRLLEPLVILQDRLGSNWIDLALGTAVPLVILIGGVIVTLLAIRRRGALWGRIGNQLARE